MVLVGTRIAGRSHLRGLNPVPLPLLGDGASMCFRSAIAKLLSVASVPL